MYSSLPSASKIYVGNATKSRVNRNFSAKRRRKKQINIHDKSKSVVDYDSENKETETLVASTGLSSVSFDKEFDFVHQSSDNEGSSSGSLSEINSIYEPSIRSNESKNLRVKCRYVHNDVNDLDNHSDRLNEYADKHDSFREDFPEISNEVLFSEAESSIHSCKKKQNSKENQADDVALTDDSQIQTSITDQNVVLGCESKLKVDLLSGEITLFEGSCENEVDAETASVSCDIEKVNTNNESDQDLSLHSNHSVIEASEILNQEIEINDENNFCKDNHDELDRVALKNDCCELYGPDTLEDGAHNVSEDNEQCFLGNNNMIHDFENNVTSEVVKRTSYSPETSELSGTESITCESKNLSVDKHLIVVSSEEDIESNVELHLFKEDIQSNAEFKISTTADTQIASRFDLELQKTDDLNLSNYSLASKDGKEQKSLLLYRSLSFPCDGRLKFEFFKSGGNESYNTQSSTQTSIQSGSIHLNNVLYCNNCTKEMSQQTVFSNELNTESDSQTTNDSEDLGFQCHQTNISSLAMKQARLRSYVVGNIGASGSLLGAHELTRHFPEGKATVFVGTWNMNCHDPPNNIDDFLLPLSVSTMPDIYVIGVQECMPSKSEWEVLTQTTLGPSHVLFTSASLGALHLSIFLRRELIWFCSEPEEASVATRPGTMVKTKGAVAIAFTFFGTSFLFINSHLTAHEKNLKERFCDYEKICSALDLPKLIPLKFQYRSEDVTSRFDNVFWNGDLNFRVVQDRSSVLSFVEEKLKNTVSSCNVLLKHDQLQNAMTEGIVFHGFKEGSIDFIPSYKFDIGTSTFDTEKERVPSYTDRILYRCKNADSVSCVHYNAVPELLTSDHKPVFGFFEVNIKPGRDNIPMAAGLFKRDVYLEANRRRAMALQVTHNNSQSTICAIM